MAFRFNKAEVLKMACGMKDPHCVARQGDVILMDGNQAVATVYRAYRMNEDGLISAMNQSGKYNKWIRGVAK